MFEEPDEGNPEQPSGGAESSTSSPSGGAGQPLPEYVTAIISRLDKQDKLLRGLQKGTDKQIGEVKGEIKRILELKEQGLNEGQIERELWIDRQMGNQNAPAPAVPDKGEPRQGGDSISVADAIAQIERYKLSPNDPEVIQLFRDKNLTSSKVKDYILGKVAPQPPASPATATQGAARTSAQDDGGKRFSDKYDAELAKIPRGNIQAIRVLRAKIKQEAKEAGYNITF